MGSFHFAAITDSAAVDICVPAAVQSQFSVLWGIYLGVEELGLRTFGSHEAVFYSSCSVLHAPQPRRRVQVSAHA